jgi:hypothetical protein
MSNESHTPRLLACLAWVAGSRGGLQQRQETQGVRQPVGWLVLSRWLGSWSIAKDPAPLMLSQMFAIEKSVVQICLAGNAQ